MISAECTRLAAITLLKLPPDTAADALARLVIFAWRTSIDCGHPEAFATDLAARFGHGVCAQIRLITASLNPTRH
jgi:hypothetical protein